MIVWHHIDQWLHLIRPLSPYQYIGGVLATLFAAYVYYCLVEYPSHLLARKLVGQMPS